MRLPAALVVLSISLAPPSAAQSLPTARVTIVSGTLPDGRATDLWLAALRRRLPPMAFDSVAGLRLPLIPAEQGWSDAIRSRAAHWESELPRMAALFPGLEARSITVVIGNRGAEDAFTHDSTTIGFDLSALVRVYGAADGREAGDRLDRFFRHEVTHTLQKRWLARHRYAARTAIEHALLDLWLEGLGNFFSLSARWHPGADGAPTDITRRTLANLEPRFVARMTTLACADSTTAAPLLADLSAGPFEQKWGALPVALWLLEEHRSDSLALRAFAVAGPAGIWPLAQRHLSRPLADSLAQARVRAARCP